jgi:hypothetical protein
MRVCLVGNSHLAAIKLGWDAVKLDYPDIACNFFGAPRNALRGLSLDGGVLVPTNEALARQIKIVSGGPTTLRPSDYDAICCVGLRFGFYHWLRSLPAVHSLSIEALWEGSALVSNSFLRHVARYWLEHSTAVLLMRMMRSVCAVPLSLLPTPLAGEALLDDLGARPMAKEQMYAALAGLYAVFQGEAQRCAVAEGFHLIPQPSTTMVSPCFSLPEFRRKSVPLKDEYQDDKSLHMNQSYGTEAWVEIAKALRAAPERPAPPLGHGLARVI